MCNWTEYGTCWRFDFSVHPQTVKGSPPPIPTPIFACFDNTVSHSQQNLNISGTMVLKVSSNDGHSCIYDGTTISKKIK